MVPYNKTVPLCNQLQQNLVHFPPEVGVGKRKKQNQSSGFSFPLESSTENDKTPKNLFLLVGSRISPQKGMFFSFNIIKLLGIIAGKVMMVLNKYFS